ncbi:MAG: hypothetical protein E7288_02060 [Lachnospiraceae bacterium]|nr:hypothetical protein [Lachnospiraceae bacterium]
MLTRKPMILVFAGPNGSGKSTITQYLEKIGVYTNADDIVATTGMSNEDAALFADERRYASIAAREDFTFETVLSSEYKLELLEKAKSEGYFIKCIYVLTIDPYINVARVETRVALGGHNVETDKIIKRYYKSLNNVKRLLEICDILHVYDNTFEPIRIIRKHKGELSIFPNELWSEDKIIDLMGEKLQR